MGLFHPSRASIFYWNGKGRLYTSSNNAINVEIKHIVYIIDALKTYGDYRSIILTQLIFTKGQKLQLSPLSKKNAEKKKS